MRKTILLSLFQIASGVLTSYSQNNGPGSLYLTNYTISPKQNEIGKVELRNATGAQIQSITLEGESKDAFRIGKDHKLSVKKEKLKPGTYQFDIFLTVHTSSGKIEDTVRIVKDEFIRNKVIAHRGAWKNTGATENSIAALNHAIALGCEGREFDVRMSSDSLLVINHDSTIQGVSIARTSSTQLTGIKLSNGERLPTLQDYLLAGTRQNKTKLILEIKPSPLGKANSIALTHKVVELVEQLRAQAWVDYISFDYDVCKEILKLAPYAKVAYLNGDKSPVELEQDRFFGLDYHYTVLQKNPDWIKEAKQKKLTVNVWTVNDKAAMEGLLKEKVDFITTNEPELLLNMISVK